MPVRRAGARRGVRAVSRVPARRAAAEHRRRLDPCAARLRDPVLARSAMDRSVVVRSRRSPVRAPRRRDRRPERARRRRGRERDDRRKERVRCARRVERRDARVRRHTGSRARGLRRRVDVRDARQGDRERAAGCSASSTRAAAAASLFASCLDSVDAHCATRPAHMCCSPVGAVDTTEKVSTRPDPSARRRCSS